jgi:glyoxylate carboligase
MMAVPASLEGCIRALRTVERLGITHVFGLPGTQTVPLYEALRRSGLQRSCPAASSRRRSWPAPFTGPRAGPPCW